MGIAGTTPQRVVWEGFFEKYTFKNLKKIFLMFIYVLRERQSVSRRGAERESGRHRIQNRLQLRAVSTEPDVGLKLLNCEIMP